MSTLSAPTAQTKSKQDISALSRLDTTFAHHMAGVNTLILDRFQSEVPLIPRIAAYLIAAGGKRIRPLLCLAAASFTHDDKAIEKAYGFAAAVEFIHTATLLHDDVVDESDQRRGKKSANLVFGNQATVLVGDYLFSKSFELMVEGGSLKALSMLSNASAIIAEGEVLQLSHLGDMSLSLDTYFKIIECKTAALFRAAMESGAIISGQDEAAQKAMYEYGHNLGMCFQIADDLIDYTSTDEKMGKKAGDDFNEGKLTLPVLLALKKANEPELAFWKRCFETKDIQNGDFEHALELFKTHDILKDCFEICHTYGNKAITALTALPDCTTKDDLSALINEIINRAS